MRRLFPHEPPVSPSLQPLHPVLQAALNGLDVQLETELTRYRRQRVGKANRGRTKQRIAPDIAAANASRNRQAADMLAIGAIGGRSQPLSEAPSSVGHPIAGAKSVDVTDYDPWQSESQSGFGSGAIASPDSATLHPRAGTPETAAALNLSSAASEPNADAEVDDYFASSEELLRSLSEEEVELRRQQDPKLLESLLTPLGIGSLLLLVLSSVTVGYLILNPASFKALDRFLSHQNSVSTEPTGASGEISSAAPFSGSTSPNLSAEEFKDVNVDTLPTLPKTDATVTPVPTVASAASPKPAASSTTEPDGIPGVATEQRSARTAAASPVPSTALAPVRRSAARRSSQVGNSARGTEASDRSPSSSRRATQTQPSTQAARPSRTRPTAVSPSPAAPARSTARLSQPSPEPEVATRPTQPAAAGRYYYVTSPYSGDRSLEQARQAVGDAYVRNFPTGAQVQLGAFSDETRARELAQQLAQQGVSAQVYSP
jgi:SPOR domain